MVLTVIAQVINGNSIPMVLSSRRGTQDMTGYRAKYGVFYAPRSGSRDMLYYSAVELMLASTPDEQLVYAGGYF